MTLGSYEREAIEQYYESLITDLSVTLLLDKLIDTKILQTNEQRQIRRERNLKRRNKKFLQILQQKSNEEFYRFCKILESSDIQTLISLGQTLRQEAENRQKVIEINDEIQLPPASPPNNGIILEDTE